MSKTIDADIIRICQTLDHQLPEQDYTRRELTVMDLAVINALGESAWQTVSKWMAENGPLLFPDHFRNSNGRMIAKRG